MTFDPNVPNAGQSPGLFPAQNNTNFQRLQTLVNAEHVFNDTAQADDGCHRQMTLVNRAQPSSVPALTNSMLYGYGATDSVNELWFYDSVSNKQLNWRQIDGTVTINNIAYATISAIPANCYGYVYLFYGLIMQESAFVSNGSVVNGYAPSVKYQPGSGEDYIIRIANGSDASGLNLRAIANVTSVSGVSTNQTYNYRIFYRLI